jgi:hypothetical protein
VEPGDRVDVLGTFRDPKRVSIAGTVYAIAGTSVIRETDAGNVTVASSAIGSGAPLVTPAGIAALADGSLVVTDTRTNLLVKIDPATGARTILSGVGNY